MAARKGNPNVANLRSATQLLEQSIEELRPSAGSIPRSTDAAALAAQATAMATIAMARDTTASHAVLLRIEVLLTRLFVGESALRTDLGNQLRTVAETSEATRSQLQRLANNITSRR